MKRALIIIFALLAISLNVGAQQASQKGKFDIVKFKKDRIDFLVKEIGLTDAESKVFIPLCDELLSKKFELNKEVRRKIRNIRQKGASATSADYEQYNDMLIESKLKEAQLDKEYYLKMKAFMSAEKIYKYQNAEKQFVRKTVNQSK